MDYKQGTVVSISMVKLNIWALIVTIVMLFGVPIIHLAIFGEAGFTVTLPGLILFLAAMIIIVCIHEAIHLMGFRYIAGVPRQELAWGINWKLGAAYAHAKKPVKAVHMKKVLLLPLIPTGILPLALGVSIDLLPLSFLGIILMTGCLGDIALYRKLAKFPNSALVLDHPSKPQFTVYERDDYDWSLENDMD
ncbi:DUF3267 domain-containing protein [Lentibacillus sp. CBA3610]|uniref:DUF3267 domain-containing protein n=1 Tax=Lentibacillus sp. CBA3610 TaxID=2518176 RepID=UPI00159616CD|nr:DUF3267 domain-containing protein [Lentibacillus sp. CBA3610]QKY70696.1 DUF3267 domain-containing protein [Lentibacillus sp. CBA3610]